MTPPALEHVVKTCLAKDPEERFQTAHDVKLQLRWISESGSQVSAAPVVRRKRSRERLAWAAALLVVTALAAAGWLWKRSAWSYDTPIVTTILPPEKGFFALTGNEGGPVEVSPDGRMLTFLATNAEGKSGIWVRDLSQGAARPLPGTEGGKAPFWSRDSHSVAFFAGGKLKRVEVSGGPAVTVCDATNARGGAWLASGVILFTPNTQNAILRVSDNGGQPEPVTQIDTNLHTTHRWPFALPDGKHFLYLAANHRAPSGEQNAVYWASLDGKQSKMLVHSVANAAFANGYLLFLRENALMAQPFDPGSGALTGSPTPVVDGVLYDSGVWRGVFSVSQNGVLAYQPGGSTVQGVQMEWRDRSGKQLGNWGGQESYFGLLAFSPDGGRVAATIGDPAADLWVFDLKRGVRTRLTFQPTGMQGPIWSPDGSRIAFTANYSGKWGLYTKAANGAGQATQMAEIQGSIGTASDWSRDGKYLLFAVLANETRQDIWLLPVGQDNKAAPLLKTPAQEDEARFSPDERWIAYVSNESGRAEVYVTPFPNVGPKWQISSEGGYLPQWSRDGHELFFLRPDNTVMTAPIAEKDSSVEVGTVKPLFKLNSPPGIFAAFVVTPDDSRFLATSSVGGASGEPLTLVVNWMAGLKK
jgi:Tol biopolymer transport system component